MNTRGSTGDAHPPARWSPAERAMWRAYRQGEWCTPAAGSTDPALRADRVRHLLLHRPEPVRGQQAALRLRGFTIRGGLDLRDVELACVVEFDECGFTDPLAIDGLTAPALRLTVCRLPGIHADRLDLLRGLTVARSTVDGSVYLRDARIGAQLDLTGSSITPTGYTGLRPKFKPGTTTPPEYVGIDAENIVVHGDFRGVELTWCGALFLNSARIDGALFLMSARCPEGFIQAPSLAAGGVYAHHEFHLNGTMNLYGATVNGPVDLAGARILNPGQIAFQGWDMTVAGSLTTSEQTHFAGTVDLHAVDIRGGLQLDGIRCTDPGPDGSLHLPRAVIRGGLSAIDARTSGAVCLTLAQVAASVDLARVTIAEGMLDADNISVGGDFDVTDATVDGAVTLRGARVVGTVDFLRTTLGTTDGYSIQADGLVAFQLSLECHTPPGDVELGHATVEVLADRAHAWPAGPGRPMITDFTYRRLRHDMPVDQRLAVMHRATPTIAPQPYEHLAAVYRSAGRELQARRVLREKLRRESRASGWPLRIWGAVQDLAVGYGYRPGRAAAIFGALLLGGTAYFAAVPDCAGAGGLCPVNAGDQRTWDPFLYVLDVLVPIVDIGHEKAWNPTGPDKVVMIALLVSGWVYATALVAAAGRALSRS